MNDWQPIETAPKDGTEILACGTWYQAVVHWGQLNEENVPPGWLHHDGKNDPMWYRMGYALKYWMPLPPLPNSTSPSAPASETRTT